MSKRYAASEIEMLRKNPNVKEISEKRLVLTYECRMAIYKKWLENPEQGTVRFELEALGIPYAVVGKDYVHSIHKVFKTYGEPRNGKSEVSVHHIDKGMNEKLVETGKFEYCGKDKKTIRFTQEFVKELAAKYPEQSVIAGLTAAGIDPAIVGYNRIYSLEKRLKKQSGMDAQSEQSYASSRKKEKEGYSEETVEAMQKHPYVSYASSKQLVFCSDLYTEAKILLEHGYSVDRVLDVYEIPLEWMTQTRKYSIYHRCRYEQSSTNGSRNRSIVVNELPADAQKQYLRIQGNRIQELESITESGMKKVAQKFPLLDFSKRRNVCEWIRDELSPVGKNSIRRFLQQLSIPKSTYYDILNNASYGESARKRNEQREEDAKIVQEVIGYKGYPKGSRQVYMQMEAITGKHMSRRKIMRIMQEHHWQSTVRKANMNRRASQKYMKSHVKPNLLRRRFRLHHPGEVFATDVTYMRYGPGKKNLAYGSASIDTVTGRLYAFHVSASNNLDLVMNMMRDLPVKKMYEAVKPMLHSDQGVLYLTDEFQELVKELGMEQSMSKRGNCWDNACQESFFGHFKDECSYTEAHNLDELKEMVSEYSIYYNEERGQWNRNRMTPLAFEAYLNQMTPEEFQAWQKQEEERYAEMKRKAGEKAIERAKTLGV